MNWWCAASEEPWSWAPRAYPGIWLSMALLLAGYLLAWRHAPQTAPSTPGAGAGTSSASAEGAGGTVGGTAAGLATGGEPATGMSDTRRRVAFVAGWALLWAATDWPLGTLGAGYLATAHMAQYVLYTMAAAPLLVLGIPEWMLRRGLSRIRAYRLVRAIGRPLPAGLLFNAVLVATHAPFTVDTLRTNQLGSFALDVAWLVSALLLWLPVCGPLDEVKPSLPARGVYLFLAAGLVPMVPGGFLTFAEAPLYAVYELAPRVAGFDALDDQQAAGAIMKVGNLPLLWPVLAGIFIRWAAHDRTSPARPTPQAARADPAEPRA